MIRFAVMLHVLALDAAGRLRRRLPDDSGQSTAEYALVLLGAAAVALLVVAWATKSGKVTELLNSVIDNVISRVA